MFTFVGIVTGIARIIIWLVRFILKILLIPVIIGLTLLEWICTIAVGFFGPLFDIFGVVLIATGFLSYGFGLWIWVGPVIGDVEDRRLWCGLLYASPGRRMDD